MDRTNVKRILAHLNKARVLLNSMSNKDKEEILKLHNERASLPYCLRWGITAAENIIEDYPGRVKK